MEQKFNISELIENASALYERKKDLFLLNVADKVSTISSSIASSVIILFVGAFFLLFGGLALAWWIGESLNSIPLGFCIVTGFFALLIAFTIFFGKKIIHDIIMNLIIKKIVYDNDSDK